MTEQPRISPAAKLDLSRIYDFMLDQDSASIAVRFEAAFIEACDSITLFPELGIPAEIDPSSSKDHRIKPIRRFESYLIFYRNTQRGPLILRVLHASQDWSSMF